MNLPEKIFQSVQVLPVSMQAEVFDFVEYLGMKAKKHEANSSNSDWDSLSLSAAMQCKGWREKKVLIP